MACRRVLCGSSVYDQKNLSLSEFLLCWVETIVVDASAVVVATEDGMLNECVCVVDMYMQFNDEIEI